MCQNQTDRAYSHCEDKILDASIVELFAVDWRITVLSQFITIIAQEQVADIQLHCHLVLECSNQSKVKTAPTLFCRLFWENDSNEGKGQNENEDTKLAYNTNKNQEPESLFQRLQTYIEHSTNSTPTKLEAFVDDRTRSQVSQLQTVIKQKMKLLEATGKRPSKLEQLFKASPTNVIYITQIPGKRPSKLEQIFQALPTNVIYITRVPGFFSEPENRKP